MESKKDKCMKGLKCKLIKGAVVGLLVLGFLKLMKAYCPLCTKGCNCKKDCGCKGSKEDCTCLDNECKCDLCE